MKRLTIVLRAVRRRNRARTSRPLVRVFGGLVICRADVVTAGDRAPCTRPASDKSDPSWPLCARCLGLKLEVERRWGAKKDLRR